MRRPLLRPSAVLSILAAALLFASGCAPDTDADPGDGSLTTAPNAACHVELGELTGSAQGWSLAAGGWQHDGGALQLGDAEAVGASSLVVRHEVFFGAHDVAWTATPGLGAVLALHHATDYLEVRSDAIVHVVDGEETVLAALDVAPGTALVARLDPAQGHLSVLADGAVLAEVELDPQALWGRVGLVAHGQPVAVEHFAVTARHCDAQPPGAPLEASAEALGEHSARVQWVASSDDGAVAGYRVLRDGVIVHESLLGDGTFVDDGLEPGQRYSYQVVAVDLSGAETSSAAVELEVDWNHTPFLAATASVEATEHDFLTRINQERKSRGLGALKVFWDLHDDARAHSLRMKQQDDLHHNPNLSSVTLESYWLRLGENVGVGGSAASLHDAFMKSPGHRDNILGDYTHAGVGVVFDDSTIWVTVVFMKAARSGLENTLPPFVDDDFSPHERNIHKIWKAGLTRGCGGGAHPKYCPERTLSRAEMAVFLTRALKLPATSRDHFTDDNGAWYEDAVNRLAESGVTYGCGDKTFCPEADVTRGQMAAFLVRAFDLPPATRDHFGDDAGRFYEDSANRLAEANISNGCGGTNFCGEEPITRAQVAAFMARAMGL